MKLVLQDASNQAAVLDTDEENTSVITGNVDLNTAGVVVNQTNLSENVLDFLLEKNFNQDAREFLIALTAAIRFKSMNHITGSDMDQFVKNLSNGQVGAENFENFNNVEVHDATDQIWSTSVLYQLDDGRTITYKN